MPKGLLAVSSCEPLVLSTIVSHLGDCFVRRGLDFAQLAKQVGITPDMLEDQDGYVNLNNVATLLEMGAEQTADPCFGLHCAHDYTQESVSPLGFMVANAPTTQVALQALNRYMRLIVTPIEMSCRTEQNYIYLSIRYRSEFTVPRLQCTLFTIALLIRRLRQSAGDDWLPEQLYLDHYNPGCPAKYTRILARRILYNRPVTTIIIDKNSLQRNLAGANKQLYRIMQTHVKMLAQNQPKSTDIVGLTKHNIERLLNNGTPSLAAVADELLISPRTLQARLNKADTSFTTLLDDVRRERTHYYLTETDMQMTEIAFLLGFSELSAFTRAATRLLKKPPRNYRQAIREL